MKNGISLIVLIVTIIIIIIIATTLVLSLSKNNPIEQANKSVFLNDLNNFKTELDIYIMNKLTDTLGVDNSNTLNATTTTTPGLTDIIPSMTNSKYDLTKFSITNGKLTYTASDVTAGWANEVDGIIVNGSEPTEANGLDINTLEYAWSVTNTAPVTGWTLYNSNNTLTFPTISGINYFWLRITDTNRNVTTLEPKEVTINSNTTNPTTINEFTPRIENVAGLTFDIVLNATSDNSNIIGYEIFLNNNYYDFVRDTDRYICNKNLTLNTNYAVEVVAIDDKGTIRKSNMANVKTLDRLEIITANNKHSEITGDWYEYIGNTTYDKILMSTDGYNVSASNSNIYSVIQTKNKIDLTNINTLTMDVDLWCNGPGHTNRAYLGVTDSTGHNTTYLKSISNTTYGTTKQSRTLTLDVSDITGEHYIKLIIQHGSEQSYYTTSSTIKSLIGT